MEATNVVRLARWSSYDVAHLECHLCPHHCCLKEGEIGICRTRGVLNGRMTLFNYGRVCVQAVDQIEKKPIYHYRPGSKLLSVGTFGCNLDCDCCQNAALASSGAADVECPEVSADALVGTALEKGAQGIAFTFNEPLVWSEFVIDVAKLSRGAGLFTMMNSNGFVESEPLAELASAVDVFKVDVKGFSEGFYRRHCGGSLSPVLKSCEMIQRNGNHLEIAYLIIPGLNDRKTELTGFFDWARNVLGRRVPVHLYRFMPAHRLSHLPPTDMSVMRSAKEMAERAGLDFVYLSGMVEGDEHRTLCPRCGHLVIDRAAKAESEKVVCDHGRVSKFCPSYSEIIDRTKRGACPECGEIIYRTE
ncbi:MAG: AmmeMemoRadiSam system radical SAM enzyme [Methanomassiliicoccales archaeon]|nr:AmmeMemoRadiSam system radical SAM enzyme [Methanomassiliicoccales archaeon]